MKPWPLKVIFMPPAAGPDVILALLHPSVRFSTFAPTDPENRMVLELEESRTRRDIAGKFHI